MANSTTTRSPWMYNQGTDTIGADDIVATEAGWCLVDKKGRKEVLCCLGGIVDAADTTPVLRVVTFPENGHYVEDDVLTFVATFNEKVKWVTAAPVLNITLNGVSKTATTTLAQNTLSLDITFTYTVGSSDAGPLVISNITATNLRDSDNNSGVTGTLPVGHLQPNVTVN